VNVDLLGPWLRSEPKAEGLKPILMKTDEEFGLSITQCLAIAQFQHLEAHTPESKLALKGLVYEPLNNQARII